MHPRLAVCSLLAAIILSVLGCRSTSAPEPTGTLQTLVLVVPTNYAATDTDGVAIVVDDRPPHRVTASYGEWMLTGVTVGQHSVRVGDVEANCVLDTPSQQTATVRRDSLTQVVFSGVCN